MQVEYRDLGKGDYKGLRSLIKSVYGDTPKAMFFFGEPTDEELKDLFRRKLIAMKERKVVDMVALSEGMIIGECELVLNGIQAVVGEIVEKSHRSNGVGSALLESCIASAWSMGVKQFYAEVDEENKRAIGFFLKTGFKPRKIRNGKLVLVLDHQ